MPKQALGAGLAQMATVPKRGTGKLRSLAFVAHIKEQYVAIDHDLETLDNKVVELKGPSGGKKKTSSSKGSLSSVVGSFRCQVRHRQPIRPK